MRVGAITVPAAQRRRLTFTETERRIDRIDQHRDVDVPALRARRFVANEMPFRADRLLAPDHDHAPGGIELMLDRPPPFVAGAYMLVPPDRIAVGLERLDQRLDPPPVFRLVGDEDVAHQPAPCRDSSTVGAALTTCALRPGSSSSSPRH